MNKRKIKLVIFDLDGTLVDAYKAVSRSLNFALKKVHLKPIDDYTVQRSVGWGERRLIRSLVPNNLVEKVLSIYRAHHKHSLKTGTKFLPGAKAVLTRLKKKGYRLTIASNRTTRFTRIILKTLNILHHFDYVLCADKVKRPKPSADLIKETLKRFSLKPSEAVYVGDMSIDALTGKRARVKTIAVTTGSSTKKEILMYEPYSVVERISQAPQIIENLY